MHLTNNKMINKYFQCFLLLLIPLLSEQSESADILGCQGFVKSQYKLDFGKIEIKLFTKQGSLKMKTECSPTTGYYFIPLETKGDYILKISPPELWAFEPNEYYINFDEKTDQCSLGVDLNFGFKGFSISGKINTEGVNIPGPSDVKMTLTDRSGSNLKLTSTTGKDGIFSFDSIPPGKYSLKVEQNPKIIFKKDNTDFEITNQNIVIENKIIVSGYELSGKVKSEDKPVEGVTIVLFSKEKTTTSSSIADCSTKMEGITLQDIKDEKFICHKPSDKNGKFTFSGLSPGKYSLIAVYKGKNNIVYNMSPLKIEFTMENEPLVLKTSFEVEGFTVQGRVKGLPGAQILVNGENRATSGHDGYFTISKMKQGTYDFEIIAEKFQFDKIKVEINPSNPIISDFIPSRFLICGFIKVTSSKSTISPLTLAFQRLEKNEKTGIVHKEKITDTNNCCVFLPEGNYETWVEMDTGVVKYFIPEKTNLKVPGGNFHFSEFIGNIEGSVECQNCDDTKIILTKKDGLSIERILTSGEKKFKFENFDSGVYKIEVVNPKFCWKENVMEKIELKNTNIDNLNFQQTGYALSIIASHNSDIKIELEKPTGATKLKSTTNTFATQTFKAIKGETKTMCLQEGQYKLSYSGCHIFEKPFYTFVSGSKENNINLVAKKHKISGKLFSPGKITDLQIKINGEILKNSGDEFVKEAVSEGQVEYEFGFIEGPEKQLKLEIFSYGYIFEPNNINIITKDECGENTLPKIYAKKSHVIKGKLTPPISGVEIRIELLGDPDGTTYVFSNSNGEYIAGPFVHSGSYKVIPDLQGYSFKEDQNDPYSFTVLKLAKIQIKVVAENSGDPISNVLLSLSGPNSYRQNKMTDQNGAMSFGDLNPGPYFMKALLKEFQFEPSSGAVHIDLKEEETKEFTLTARRESFSLYGQLNSLTGDSTPNLLLTAKGIGNCSEYGEEGLSDENGNFRIWALKSFCTYKVSVVQKVDDDALRSVERTIPDSLELKIGTEDIHNISFTIISPVKRMDISLHCYTNNKKSLDNLKAMIYSSLAPEAPLYQVPFSGIPYIIMPPIPKDNLEYFITFESTLNKNQYIYALPMPINFTADKAYEHYDIELNIELAQFEQEIGKNSYIAFAFFLLVIITITNFERISELIKMLYESYLNSRANNSGNKKAKSKSKLL